MRVEWSEWSEWSDGSLMKMLGLKMFSMLAVESANQKALRSLRYGRCFLALCADESNTPTTTYVLTKLPPLEL